MKKNECMLFGSANTLKKYEHFQKITVGSSSVDVVTVVRNLGVYIDNKLSMNNHILHVVKTCNYHIRNIAFIRKYLSEDILKTVIFIMYFRDLTTATLYTMASQITY